MSVLRKRAFLYEPRLVHDLMCVEFQPKMQLLERRIQQVGNTGFPLFKCVMNNWFLYWRTWPLPNRYISLDLNCEKAMLPISWICQWLLFLSRGLKRRVSKVLFVIFFKIYFANLETYVTIIFVSDLKRIWNIPVEDNWGNIIWSPGVMKNRWKLSS